MNLVSVSIFNNIKEYVSIMSRFYESVMIVRGLSPFLMVCKMMQNAQDVFEAGRSPSVPILTTLACLFPGRETCGRSGALRKVTCLAVCSTKCNCF